MTVYISSTSTRRSTFPVKMVMENGSGLTRSSTMIQKIGVILKAIGAMRVTGVMTMIGALTMTGALMTRTPAVAAHVLTPILMTTPGNPQGQ